MALDPVPPPSPMGNPYCGSRHHCNSKIPCIIPLSDIGKGFHAFPQETFHVHYNPPAISREVLHHFASHHFSWSWTTKAELHKGKIFSVPTIPIACRKDAPKVLCWTVSLFHSFKSHLNTEALDVETGKVLPPIVRLYQSYILLHFCSQLKSTPPP